MAAVLFAGGCGSSSSTSTTSASTAPQTQAPSTPVTTAASTTAPPGGTSALQLTTKHSKLGTVLAAGPEKLTVYLFEGDKGSNSSCSGACAKVWPPVTTTGSAQAAGSAVAADLSTITRSDGTKQVTYKGHPLYFFEKDKDNADAYGQGSTAFGAGWYVLAPTGNKIDHS